MVKYNWLWPIIYSGVMVGVFSSRRQENDLLNQCSDNKRRKAAPSGNSDSFSFCQQWQMRSCCTADTVKSINFHGNERLDGTKWDLCGSFTLSYRCKMMFKYESCFYECEPNLGPWAIPKNSIPRQEFEGIPICASSCDLWYKMCEQDFTCAKNWPKDMVWTPSGNKCRSNSTCRSYSEVYGSGKAFCENIRGSTYRYISDNKNCLQLRYYSLENPNTKVVQEMFKVNTTERQQTGTIVTSTKNGNTAASITYNLISHILPLYTFLHLSLSQC